MTSRSYLTIKRAGDCSIYERFSLYIRGRWPVPAKEQNPDDPNNRY